MNWELSDVLFVAVVVGVPLGVVCVNLRDWLLIRRRQRMNRWQRRAMLEADARRGFDVIQSKSSDPSV